MLEEKISKQEQGTEEERERLKNKLQEEVSRLQREMEREKEEWSHRVKNLEDAMQQSEHLIRKKEEELQTKIEEIAELQCKCEEMKKATIDHDMQSPNSGPGQQSQFISSTPKTARQPVSLAAMEKMDSNSVGGPEVPPPPPSPLLSPEVFSGSPHHTPVVPPQHCTSHQEQMEVVSERYTEQRRLLPLHDNEISGDEVVHQEEQGMLPTGEGGTDTEQHGVQDSPPSGMTNSSAGPTPVVPAAKDSSHHSRLATETSAAEPMVPPVKRAQLELSDLSTDDAMTATGTLTDVPNPEKPGSVENVSHPTPGTEEMPVLSSSQNKSPASLTPPLSLDDESKRLPTGALASNKGALWRIDIPKLNSGQAINNSPRISIKRISLKPARPTPRELNPQTKDDGGRADRSTSQPCIATPKCNSSQERLPAPTSTPERLLTPEEKKGLAVLPVPPNSTELPLESFQSSAKESITEHCPNFSVVFSEEEEEEMDGVSDKPINQQINRVQLFLKMDCLRKPKKK